MALLPWQLQAELEHEFAWHGARAPAYATIVGGGENPQFLLRKESE